jgi:hypothetical protein
MTARSLQLRLVSAVPANPGVVRKEVIMTHISTTTAAGGTQ